MKYKNLVFDTHNIYYRALWKNEDRHINIEGKSIRTGGILKTIKMIEYRIENYLEEDGRCYFLFDNPTSRDQIRKQINFEYKSNREKMRPEFYKGLNYLQAILKSWRDNTFIIREHKTEADDFVDPIVQKHKNESTLVISTDMDWARNITDNCHWLDRRIVYDKTEFEKKYGFIPSRKSVCFYKAFYGDKVDNIKPALAQLPRTFFLRVIDECDDIYDFVNKVSNNKLSFLDDGWILRVSRDRNLLTKNWKLVDFIGLTEADLSRHCIEGKFKPEKLKIIYSTLGFTFSEIDIRLNTEVNVLDGFVNGDIVKRK